MKKKLLIVGFATSLFATAAFAVEKFDVSSKEDIQRSIKSMKNDLNEDQAKSLNKAIMFFSMGSPSDFKVMMKIAKLDKIKKETLFLDNIHVLKGLTGEEIIAKYVYAKKELKKAKAVNTKKSNKEK
ncbi:MAG: hypothetical protein JKX67_01615 [Colwellia sp.]|nr:hypothetical protein [Colwellia sp.]